MSWRSKIPKVAEISWVNLESDLTPIKDGIKLKIRCGSFYLPKQSETLGEDAHFICAEQNTIGVADGVGGWAKHGVDAGEYARKLMENSVRAIRNQRRKLKQGDHLDVDPIRVLHEAYAKTKNIAGTSTACIVTLGDQGKTLHAVNVGDSGFMLFRDNKCVYISPIRQRYFNCPFQLGKGSTESPESATEIKVRVLRQGDVIVLATDGLLDNVTPREIEQVLEENPIDCVMKPKMLAWIIAERLALRNSEDERRLTPYAIAAQKAGVDRTGGKRDDITVVVGQILVA